MKKLFMVSLFACLFFHIYAQDAEILTDILHKDAVNFMDFSYLIGSQSGMDIKPFEAWAYCDRFDTFPLQTTSNTPITVEQISFFLMTSYEIKGGLMWSLLKNERYAWKELKASGLWDYETDPQGTITGLKMIQVLTRFFNLYPDAILRSPGSEKPSAMHKNALLAGMENHK